MLPELSVASNVNEALPVKLNAGSKRMAAACVAFNEMPAGFAANTAAVKSAKPPVQVAPDGVGGQGMLNTPWPAGGKVLIK